jgi:PQQ-dependent dehydrogenase (methanol/ethanol family)
MKVPPLMWPAQGSAVEPTMGFIDDERIKNAASEPGNWLSFGRTYEEQRHSPLTQINKETVGQLGLAWYKDMNTNRAQEATPIVVDDTMFFSSTWSKVFAVDAITGETKWSYDPRCPGEWARKACCDVVNRGVAVYKGRVYVGTLDGRLVALDAATGSVVWEVDTLIDRTRFYTITGAPRVANGKVFIGNGGAEFGVRGYVTAYDAESGEEVWRFFTVPWRSLHCHLSIQKWSSRQKHGKAAAGGSSAVAVPCGTPLSMTPISTRFTLASVMARLGHV